MSDRPPEIKNSSSSSTGGRNGSSGGVSRNDWDSLLNRSPQQPGNGPLTHSAFFGSFPPRNPIQHPITSQPSNASVHHHHQQPNYAQQPALPHRQQHYSGQHPQQASFEAAPTVPYDSHELQHSHVDENYRNPSSFMPPISSANAALNRPAENVPLEVPVPETQNRPAFHKYFETNDAPATKNSSRSSKPTSAYNNLTTQNENIPVPRPSVGFNINLDQLNDATSGVDGVNRDQGRVNSHPKSYRYQDRRPLIPTLDHQKFDQYPNNSYSRVYIKNYVPKERELEEIFAEDSNNLLQNGLNGDAEIEVNGNEILQPVQSWNQMNLDGQLLQNIQATTYSQPRKIQQFAIPYIQNYYNTICQSETGSGKTAAYLVPIVDNLIKDKQYSNFPAFDDGPFALIVSPSRELTHQIYEQAKKFCYRTSISVACCYGQYSPAQNLADIRKGCNILCACLGRLMDFAVRKHISLKNVRYLVIDEVDKLMDDRYDKYGLLNLLNFPSFPSKNHRLTCLFSATLKDPVVEEFIDEYVSGPKMVEIMAKNQSNSRITYKIMAVPSIPAKYRYLLNYLKEISAENNGICPKVVVFVNRKIDVDRVAIELTSNGFVATTIHADRTQNLRDEALDYFRRDKASILVATNVFERGVDIKHMDYVINFDIHSTRSVFLQRCGRTGRTKNGTAMSFYYEADDREMAPIIEKILYDAGQVSPEFLRFGVQEDDFKYGGAEKKISHQQEYYRNAPSTSDRQVIIPDNNVDAGWDWDD